MRVWPLFAGLLAAACQFDGGLGTGLLCPTGECPAGQVCSRGVCIVPGGENADAQAVSDSGAPADGAPEDGAPDGNLVNNPGMEAGVGGWASYNSTHSSSADDPHGGEKSLVVCADVSPDFTLYQDIIHPPDPVPEGGSYAASVWVRADPAGPAPGPVRLTIRERGGATELLDHDGAEKDLVATEWIQLEAQGTVQEADRENLIFIVWGLGASAGDCFAVDDARMVSQ